MGVKKMRILKQQWPNFVHDFNRENQYRRAVLAVDDRPIAGGQASPLAGLVYEQKRRVMEIYLGGMDPTDLTHLVHSISVPRAIYLVTDDEAPRHVQGLDIQGKPGKGTVYLTFLDGEPSEVRSQWVAEVAYAVYEQGGSIPGHDIEDWRTAERLIDDALRRFSE